MLCDVPMVGICSGEGDAGVGSKRSSPLPAAGGRLMRVLVTGAAGFIGSNLTDRLLADGHQVVGVDNLRTGMRVNLDNAFSHNNENPRRFTFLEADIEAPELIQIVAGLNPEVIFHLAAHVDRVASVTDPKFDARCNILGTVNLCEASRQAGVRRIVYAASGESRYATADLRPVDEYGRLDPLSPHAVGKVAGEMYLRAYGEMYGLAPICLALTSVYGPRQHPHGADGVVAGLGHAMVTGRPMVVYRDRAATHDYVYIDDVVDAFVRAGLAPHDAAGTYNIGSGQQVSISDVHGLFSTVLDGLSPPSFVADIRTESPAVALDTTKARDQLGWTPAVDLAEGIRRTVRWLCATLEPEPPALVGA